jgi:DNA-binding Lrp family transcriptional regulator
MAKIDKTDVNIINLLMDNGRLNSSEIARQIGGVLERVIRYRIDKLIIKGFIHVCAIPNPHA